MASLRGWWGKASVAAAIVACLAMSAATAAVADQGYTDTVADQGYTDNRGDAGSGSDILNTTVRHTASGEISIQVGLGSPLPQNHVLLIYIDADKNESTGDADGDDYRLLGGGFFTPSFAVWRGSSYVPTAAAGFSVTQSGNVVGFRINRSALGNTAGFYFVVYSRSVDEGSAGLEGKTWDIAGYYTYNLTAPTQCSNGLDDDSDGKVDTADPGCSSAADTSETDAPPPPAGGRTLRITKLTAKPNVPEAGSSYEVAVTVVRKGYPRQFGWSLFCEARIGQRELREFASPSGPRPRCRWDIPANAAGKSLKVTVELSEDGVTARRSYTTRVLSPLIRIRKFGEPGLSPPLPESNRLFYYLLPLVYQIGNRPVKRLPQDMASVRVQCGATIDGVPVRLVKTSIVRQSGPQCAWRLPPGTGGRTMRGSVTVQYRGALIRVVFRLPVRA